MVNEKETVSHDTVSFSLFGFCDLLVIWPSLSGLRSVIYQDLSLV